MLRFFSLTVQLNNIAGFSCFDIYGRKYCTRVQNTCTFTELAILLHWEKNNLLPTNVIGCATFPSIFSASKLNKGQKVATCKCEDLLANTYRGGYVE
jgi:hypothetical protein